ncbi:MAG TPA: hypothetical protein VF713_18060 [Thermoanaerobaculia bacterium]
MKRAAILLTLTALLAFAPSAFACWRCDTTQGCYGTDIGVGGWNDCFFDGTCHKIGGFCQGIADQTPLAASYTVAAVHVVEPETETAPDLTANSHRAPLPEPQKAEMAVVGR